LISAPLRSNTRHVQVIPPLCPSCGQPASKALAGPPHDWECRNEACPEFGQSIDADEPAAPDGGVLDRRG
jgi:hypothetical protein